MTDLRKIARSEGVFPVSELDWENMYYTADIDGKPYGYLHVQTAPNIDFCLLHITLLLFSRRVLKECMADYKTLKQTLRERGIRRMVHLKEAPFKQWEKLMRVLGFHKPEDIQIESRPCKTVQEEVF